MINFVAMDLFKIIEPTAKPVPIIISVPHAGTKFPKAIKNNYKKRMRRHLDDTDWFVDQLYDFAPALGITLVKANLSRWVIDLNRDPERIPLYDDGRLITAVVPVTDFFGNKIYKSTTFEPDQTEIDSRLKTYYWPYYHQLEALLANRKKKYGNALLWDAHSIRHKVSTIQNDPFPDMILGNNHEATAHPALIKTALAGLGSGIFGVNHNSPFKGGHITRYFGKPSSNIHTLQLEMNKILYMDDNEITCNAARLEEVKKVLRHTFESLTQTMTKIQ